MNIENMSKNLDFKKQNYFQVFMTSPDESILKGSKHVKLASEFVCVLYHLSGTFVI